MYTSLVEQFFSGEPDINRERNDIQFVQAANGRPHGFPKGEQQTHLRERFLTTREGLGTSASAVVFRDVGLNLRKE